MNKNYQPIKLGAPGEEISKKDLFQIINRFKTLHHLRLQKTQHFLQPRQRVFLDILGLIFHQNHASLPGFIDSHTPCGILDFKPGPVALQSCRQYFKNFQYRRKALSQYAIEGIYLMGSVGSVAFSRKSDLDIWLCHDKNLNPQQLDLLQQKATAVEQWADSLELEVHFFLMNAEQFRNGQHTPISSESSGATQHYLLLEEFYRTAVYIAGKAPAWWLVPPEQSQHHSLYINHLLKNRFISRQEIIDFGGLENAPADEFISATLWHIYKSLSSPYKSLLKLFLMEAYASEYPKVDWLAERIKQSVYQGEIDADKLDPYLLVYQKVEEYLNLVASQKRLALARECFYLKIMGNSPAALPAHIRKAREHYLQSIAHRWRWREDDLEQFGRKRYWNILKAVSEHHVIRDQLKQCLQMISRFASQYSQLNYRNNQDMKLIGRKLHSFLDRRPGKINLLTTRFSLRNKEAHLTLIEETEPTPKWLLHAAHPSDLSGSDKPINITDHFIDALCWIIANNLFHPQLKLHLDSDRLDLSATDLQLLLHQLHQFLSQPQSQADSLSLYASANRCQATLLVINLGVTVDEQQDHNRLLISPRSDPLSYGQQRQHFIYTTSRVKITRWGEIHCSEHQQIDGLFDCLIDYFNNSTEPLNADNLHCLCLTPMRGRSIQTRIEQLISRLRQLQATSRPWRLFIAIGQHYYMLHNQNNILQIVYLDDEAMVLKTLSSYQDHFVQTCFEPYILQNSVIPLLYQNSQSHCISIFFHSQEQQTDLYVIDERSTLLHCQYPNSRMEHIQNHLQIFLSHLIEQAKLPDDIDIHFFELQQNSAAIMSVHPLSTPETAAFSELSIRVSASDDGRCLTLYCNGESFSEQEYDDIFHQARQFILSFRKSETPYNCFINAVDVPCHLLGAQTDQQLQTAHYLNYKQAIEQQLSLSDNGITPV